MEPIHPLNRTEIISNLCHYDSRRIDNRDMNPKPTDCYCDNCFYGRHKLASQLLNAIDDINKFIEPLDMSFHD